MQLDAILFDLDGTLTDSTRLFHRAVDEALFEVTGVRADHAILTEWHNLHRPWDFLLKRHGVEDDHGQAMHDISHQKFDQFLAEDIQWIDDDVENVLRELKERHMPTGIVTNSRHKF